MTLGERIKKLRKELDLTQQKLADRLGVKQNTIALIESGKRNTSDQLLFSVCREFNISEEWLRTGEGEMFVPTPETTLDKLVGEYHLGDLEKQIILEFIGLDEKDRKGVIEYVQRLAQNSVLQAAQGDSKSMTPEEEAEQFAAKADAIEQEARAEADRYYKQLVSEKRQASQVSSAKESAAG